MPLLSRAVVVGTTRVQISPAELPSKILHLQATSAIANIYIGGPEVTVDNGIELVSVGTLTMSQENGDVLWAVSDTEGAVVKMLENR
jgi:hypothetical protein